MFVTSGLALGANVQHLLSGLLLFFSSVCIAQRQEYKGIAECDVQSVALDLSQMYQSVNSGDVNFP